MVLPAEYADVIRDMADGGNGNGGNGGSPRGGDTYNIHALDAHSFERFLKSNHSVLGDAIRHHVQQNGGTRR